MLLPMQLVPPLFARASASMARRLPALLLGMSVAVLLTAVPVAAQGLMQAPSPEGSTLPPELLQKCVITPEVAAK